MSTMITEPIKRKASQGTSVDGDLSLSPGQLLVAEKLTIVNSQERGP